MTTLIARRSLHRARNGPLRKAAPTTAKPRAQAPTGQTRVAALPEQIPRDDHALDFAGAFVNRDDAGVAVHAFDIGFARIAEAAVNLHGFVRDAVGHFACVEFCLRRYATHGLSRIFQPCSIVCQTARGFDFGLHVGEHPLNRLEFGDGFAEGFALFRVLDRIVERALCESYGLRGNADAAAVERAESNFQSLAFFTEAIFGWHFAIVQQKFDGWRRALAHFVFMAADFETLEGRLDEERGDSLSASSRIGFCEDDIDAG